jgi:asparagine synthase (glutamine-hydrolysing)
MCGIAGFTQFHNEQGTTENLVSMGMAIFHRGPDAGGKYLTKKVGLCHRRLSIIDLSEAGNQPMQFANQGYVIAFNGEV